MDEDQVTQTQAENVEAVEDNSAATSPVEETQTSEQSNEEGQAEDTQIDESAADETEESSEHKPTRAERRIRQLSEQVRQQAQPSQQPYGFGQSPQIQMPQYAPGEEIAPERLQADVVQTASAIANLQISEQFAHRDAVNNYQQDLVELSKVPELDDSEDNNNFIPELEEAIAEEYKEKAFRVVGVNPQTGEPILKIDPNVRLKDIANRHLKAVRAAVKKSSTQMRNSVAATADTTALRPAGQPRTDKDPKDMSIAEMEAKYGIVG